MPDVTPRHPFRFGVQVAEAASGAAWADKARRVEALGYATLVMPDHPALPVLPFGPILAAAAVATNTLRLGTLVLANDFRHPALVARDAATVDLVSDGRFELGIGAGWMHDDYVRTGVTLDPPGVRVDRLAESMAILKALFGDDPVTFRGRHYAVTDLEGFPKPVQRPHPPFLVGAGGPRLLALAAREADIVGLLPQVTPDGTLPVADTTAAATARKVDRLREAAGARFADLELHILLQRLVVTDRPRDSAADLSREWTPLTPEEVQESPHILIGTLDDIVATLRARRERYGISYVVVFERDLETFAPVVARLAGI